MIRSLLNEREYEQYKQKALGTVQRVINGHSSLCVVAHGDTNGYRWIQTETRTRLACHLDPRKIQIGTESPL